MSRSAVPAAVLFGLLCVLTFFAFSTPSAAQVISTPTPPGPASPGDPAAISQQNHFYLPIISRGGPPPPPDEEEPLETDLTLTLPQVTPGTPVTLRKDNLQFRLDNRAKQPKIVELRLLTVINGEEFTQTLPPVTIAAAGLHTGTFNYTLPYTDTPRSPAQFILTAVELPSTPGGKEIHTGTEGYYFLHFDETNANRIVLYDELGLRAQTRTLTFLNAPALSLKLQSAFSFLDTSNVLGLALYDAGDPDLVEPPDTPDPPAPTSDAAANNFILCPEWYVNLLDNNLGEDYGTLDDGWRARGAVVSVYLNGVLAFNGQLNSSGCVTIPTSGAPTNIVIYLAGAANLKTDGNNSIFMLHYDSQASTTALAALTGITNALPNVTYRPEVPGWDGFGVMSYVIQERFNGGASGSLFLYSDDCPSDSQNCSTTFNGLSAIFLRPSNQNGWRRKFLAAHEWGHKVLSKTTTGTTNDCSFQEPGVTSSHGLKTSEYSTCAAMEGWAHFVATEAWNNPTQGTNPDGAFIYWNGTFIDAETGSDQAWCINGSWLSGFNQPSLCNYYGVELDWMRQWWDFRTNDTANSPGFRPSHAYLKTIIDQAVFAGGEYDLSGALQDVISDPEMLERWVSYGCTNGIHTFGCN